MWIHYDGAVIVLLTSTTIEHAGQLARAKCRLRFAVATNVLGVDKDGRYRSLARQVLKGLLQGTAIGHAIEFVHRQRSIWKLGGQEVFGLRAVRTIRFAKDNNLKGGDLLLDKGCLCCHVYGCAGATGEGTAHGPT